MFGVRPAGLVALHAADRALLERHGPWTLCGLREAISLRLLAHRVGIDVVEQLLPQRPCLGAGLGKVEIVDAAEAHVAALSIALVSENPAAVELVRLHTPRDLEPQIAAV